MPYKIRKMPKQTCYRVYKPRNKTTKKPQKTYSKCSTLENARKQVRLLRAIEYGNNFVPRNKTRRVTQKRSNFSGLRPSKLGDFPPDSLRRPSENTPKSA